MDNQKRLTIGIAISSLWGALFAQTLVYKASDPNTYVYTASLQIEETLNETTTQESISTLILEKSVVNETDDEFNAVVVLDSGGYQETKNVIMNTHGENVLLERRKMFAHMIPNYRMFPILPIPDVTTGDQWTGSIRVKALNAIASFDVTANHTLIEQTTRLGYDAVRIDYTYSGSPDVAPEHETVEKPCP